MDKIFNRIIKKQFKGVGPMAEACWKEITNLNPTFSKKSVIKISPSKS